MIFACVLKSKFVVCNLNVGLFAVSHIIRRNVYIYGFITELSRCGRNGESLSSRNFVFVAGSRRDNRDEFARTVGFAIRNIARSRRAA